MLWIPDPYSAVSPNSRAMWAIGGCIALELRAQGHPVSFPDNPVLVDAELVDGIGDPEGWRPKRLSPEARRLLTSRFARSAEF